MDALSPAAWGDGEFKAHSGSDRERPLLLDVLSRLSARTCTPCSACCCLFSHKALLMSPQICQSLGGITGLGARSRSSLCGSWQRRQAQRTSCFTCSSWGSRALPGDSWRLRKRIETVLRGFCQDTCFWTIVWRLESEERLTFPVGRGLQRIVLYLIIWHRFVALQIFLEMDLFCTHMQRSWRSAICVMRTEYHLDI